MWKSDALPYAGAGVSVGGGVLNHFYPLTWGDVSVIVGILVAIGSLTINWYYKMKEDRRAEKLFKLKMQQEQESKKNEES